MKLLLINFLFSSSGSGRISEILVDFKKKFAFVNAFAERKRFYGEIMKSIKRTQTLLFFSL